jgi:pimeloyl-ACP methyl ester carboxylesterase
MDTLGIQKAHLVGNSFGGGIALRIATQHPDRVGKLVLMGSMGVPFDITPGLERVWGYEPSVENMKEVLHTFVLNSERIDDELARSRYEAASSPASRRRSRRCSRASATLGRGDDRAGRGA